MGWGQLKEKDRKQEVIVEATKQKIEKRLKGKPLTAA